MSKEKEENVHAGHRERLRTRFLSGGFDGFEPHEVLEYLLYFVYPRQDTNVLAHRLIGQFGSLSEVLDAPQEELLRVDGIGPAAANFLKVIPEAARCYICSRHSGVAPLDTPEKLGEFLLAHFIGRTEEVVYLLCLDSSLNEIACSPLGQGSLSSSSVDIRKIVAQVFKYTASRVVLAHNHPRGLALPSNEDVMVTRHVRQALAYLGVPLVDHIIVSANEYYSIAEHYPDIF